MVFIPGQKNANPFFEEITKVSIHKFRYGAIETFDRTCDDLIILQWPETLLDWQKPSKKNLQVLKETIGSWKKHCSIIYLVHNLESHYSDNENYKNLYEIVENSSDIMVHFGEYSRKLFVKSHPDIEHYVIPHPLYRETSQKIEKQLARQKLNISDNSIIFVAPGKIRTNNEMELLIKSFENFKHNDKKLLVPFMIKKEYPIEFPGRHRLKPFFDIKATIESLINRKFNSKDYRIDYFRKSSKELSVWISAADIVIIPRSKVLNSGVLFLGLSHEKILVGPDCGNITETLEFFDFPIFNTGNSVSITEAFTKAQNLITDDFKFPASKLEKYEPKYVTRLWDDLISRVIN